MFREFYFSLKKAFVTWWWTIDRTLLFSALSLVAFGVFMTFSASPSVADRIHVESYHFIKRQLFFLFPALGIMLGTSFLSPKTIRRISVIAFCVFFVLLIFTLFSGSEIKGAHRWVSFLGFGLQPSEFLKPLFTVVCAWILATGKLVKSFPAKIISSVLFILIAVILWNQPDFGMLVTFGAILGVQFFLSGISIKALSLLGLAGIGAAIGAYFSLEHIHYRVNNFLNPQVGDSYQVDKALATFQNAGWFGTGPGEGLAKVYLPDAHTDFILATAAEEFGFLLCGLVIFVFALIIYHGLSLNKKENNLFSILVSAGILTQIGVQGIINMSSSMHLIPTKGMTLPFISYGGSSLVSVAFAMGILLSLTRPHLSQTGE
ncbi:MAG: cell division protein FtsW [Alphaproteobacteria bacterium]|nr:cell division protein FtsW [Alphaproteobacteria bacterium]